MSKGDEHETPDELYGELDNEFGFSLDPCCKTGNVKCKLGWKSDLGRNGLEEGWFGMGKIFMNPPYSRGQLKKWLQKAYEESLKGCTVVCLIPADTSTTYWHEWVFPFADEIRFLKGRVKFKGEKTAARFASAVVIYRPPKESGHGYHSIRR